MSNESMGFDIPVGAAKYVRLARLMDDPAGPISEICIRHEHPQEEPLKRLPAKNRVIYRADSFIEYCEKFRRGMNAVYFDREQAACVLIDEGQQEGDNGKRDRVSFLIKTSRTAIKLEELLNKTLDHKSLIRTIREFHNEIHFDDYAKLITGWQKIKTTVNLMVDSEHSDSRKWTIGFESQTKTMAAEVPRVFSMSLPILEDNEYSAVTLEIEIDVIEPEKPDQKAGFVLRCYDYKTIKADMLDKQLEEIHSDLKDMDISVMYGKINE